MIGLIQLLLLFSVGLLVTMPIVFLVRLVRLIANRGQVRGAVIPGVFIAGALVSGWLIWQAVPPEWTLPFWTTVKAGADSKTYGHQIEHAAEVIATDVIVASMLGGSLAAGAATWLTRRRANA
jgi:hypothetical protein